MHVTEPAEFRRLPKKHRHKKHLLWFAAFVLMAGVVYGWILYARPLPPVNAQRVAVNVPPAQTVQLAWPSYGQAALGAQDFGLLATSGNQAPAPMASVAKIVTALAVLKEKPLKLGEQGPTITITDEDVASYNHYLSNDGSLVAVQAGEQISEYQALQAMLLPSANNMADTLARWAFGSVDNYVAYATKLTAELGMNNTRITDASGFAATTTSTATDIVALGLAALREPVLAEITAQQQATVPVAGVISNTNYVLGRDGINGIKTGNTDEAGGCFLFSAKHTLSDSESVTVVGAIMSAPTLGTALRDSLPLLRSAFPGFQPLTVLQKNQPVATFQTAWGATASAVMNQAVKQVVWIGKPVSVRVTTQDLTAPAKTGQPAADVKLNVNGSEASATAYLNQAIAGPSLRWRLLRR